MKAEYIERETRFRPYWIIVDDKSDDFYLRNFITMQEMIAIA